VFGTLAVPVITRMMAGLWEGYDASRDSRVGNLLVSTAAILVAIFSIPGPENLRRQVAAAFPAGAVDYIRKTNLAGPMFNEFVWGGYLMWALPERKIFIDGRADFYDYAGVLSEYGDWYLVQEDPRRLLDKYGVKFCLLTPTAPEANVLPLLPGWREVYRDGNSVIFAR